MRGNGLIAGYAGQRAGNEVRKSKHRKENDKISTAFRRNGRKDQSHRNLNLPHQKITHVG